MPDFSTYQKFFTPEEAQPLIELLKEHQVPYKFIKAKRMVDGVIAGEVSDVMDEVKIPSDKFEMVNRIISETTTVNLDELDPDHYLLSYTDEELEAILRNPDEWGNQDYLLARKILEKRGITFSNEELESFRKARIALLARPEKVPQAWRIAGYFFALLGGFFGVLIGLAISQSKKTLPDGSRVYTYDDATRKTGKTIIYLSLIVFAVSLTLRLTNAYMYWLDLFGIYSY